MKTTVRFLALFAATSGLLAADATPKDAVKAAAAKLADQSGYSWKSTVEAAVGVAGCAPVRPTARPRRTASPC